MITRRRKQVRILIDSGNYFVDNDNLGDRAAYQVMARRLLDVWPGAQIRLLTGNLRLIEQTLPGLQPIELAAACPRELLDEVAASDLVLATGGGFYSEAFSAHAMRILNTLQVACELGKPAAMMSASFDPVQDAALLAKAYAVLPRLQLIACREGASGPRYIRSLGVAADRVVVTGDDALELAYSARPAELGDAIGVNVRQSTYAGLDDACIRVLASVLADAGAHRSAPLVPVPTSLYGPADSETTAQLLRYAGSPAQRPGGLDSPQHVIERIGHCRVVVTSSYHAAVFALAQGVPAVTITDSVHYRMKMEGLAQQFGSACAVLVARDVDFQHKLAAAVDLAWTGAEAFRPGLLATVADRIADGQSAYRRLQHVVLTHDRAAPELIQGGEKSREQRAESLPVATWDPLLHEQTLSDLTRERDALRRICEERNSVIRTLAEACQARQREIEAITAEAQQRDAIISSLKMTCDLRLREIEAITCEAQQRDSIISSLKVTCDLRLREIEAITAEAQRRDAVISEQAAALADLQQSLDELMAHLDRVLHPST